MKKKLFLFWAFFVAIGVQAQTNTAVGVYEAKDKFVAVNRLGYLEINLDEFSVPDFSQQFEKDKEYQFMLLPKDFHKKTSTYFKGQKAAGFIKYQSRMLLVNSEVYKLTEPNSQGNNCWTLKWEDNLGKNGKCTLYVPTDSTLLFVGLGSLAKAIGPDSLRFTLSRQATASKPYLVRKPQPQQTETPPAIEKPSSSTSTPNIPKSLSDWQPKAPQTIKLPSANSGVIKGSWMGKNSNESVVQIKLNSTAKTIDYYGTPYYGTIMMEGLTYMEEGVVAIVKKEDSLFELYTRSLNTDSEELHYSIVVTYYKDILFFPTSTPGLTQMGRPAPVSRMIYCKAICEHAIGMFTTGKEVAGFPLNLYQKSNFRDSSGELVLSHGSIFSSFNQGSRVDEDQIISSTPVDEKTFNIKYICGRTGNVYIATLVYDAPTKAMKVTKVKMINSESDFPDDCYLNNATIKYVGPLKE